MRIAFLEDDASQAAIVQRWLEEAGITSVHFATGTAFREAIVSLKADMAIIDWMLPDDDGLNVLVWLRETLGPGLPVMFATTRIEEEALVAALDKGADDYLVKPLRRAEMLARIHALARRSAVTPAKAVIALGGVQLDTVEQHAQVNGQTIALTDKEFVLAAYMLKNHGRLLTRQELLENVWRTNPDIVTRTVDTHISRLRNKLQLTTEHGFSLTTVYHKGYRLEYLGTANDTQAAAPTVTRK